MKHTCLFKSFLLLVSLAVLFSSCGEEKDLGDDYVFGKDMQTMYKAQGYNPFMAETGDGYYFILGSFLFYADKTSLQPIVVCNKPNCLHYDETDPAAIPNCNAWIGAQASRPFLSYYDGDLYVLSNFNSSTKSIIPELIQISFDGSKRKTEFIFPPDTYSIAMHRGYLYYVEKSNMDEPGSVNTIMRHKLGKGEKQTEKIYESPILGGGLQDLLCYGNHLYFNEYGNFEESYTSNNKRYDILSGEISTICVDPEYPGGGCPIISNGSLYYSKLKQEEMDTENQFMTSYFTSDLKGQNVQKAFEILSPFPECMDDTYFYCGNTLDLLRSKINGESNEGKDFVLSVYDRQGKLVDTASIPVDLLTDTPSLMAGDSERLFIYYKTGTSAGIKYIQKSDIGTGKLAIKDFIEFDFDKILPGVYLPVEK